MRKLGEWSAIIYSKGAHQREGGEARGAHHQWVVVVSGRETLKDVVFDVEAFEARCGTDQALEILGRRRAHAKP